jgi:hypothetical protein
LLKQRRPPSKPNKKNKSSQSLEDKKK